jgi:hypothetical protein
LIHNFRGFNQWLAGSTIFRPLGGRNILADGCGGRLLTHCRESGGLGQHRAFQGTPPVTYFLQQDPTSSCHLQRCHLVRNPLVTRPFTQPQPSGSNHFPKATSDTALQTKLSLSQVFRDSETAYLCHTERAAICLFHTLDLQKMSIHRESSHELILRHLWKAMPVCQCPPD